MIKFLPFLSSERMLLSASRIQHTPVAFATASPTILDAAHEVVLLFLEHQHASKGHVGAEHLHNGSLQEFWILELRTSLKSIIHRCFVYRRQRQMHSQPRMCNLPTYRFSSRPEVFKNVGLDNFGPFGLSITKNKVWTILSSDFHLFGNSSRSYWTLWGNNLHFHTFSNQTFRPS